MKKQYIYPHTMRTKVKLWFWTLKDLIILGVALTLSVVSWVKIGFILPAALTVVYGFLTMRFEDTSILDFIKTAWRYFVGSQQYFEWKERKNG